MKNVIGNGMACSVFFKCTSKPCGALILNMAETDENSDGSISFKELEDFLTRFGPLSRCYAKVCVLI